MVQSRTTSPVSTIYKRLLLQERIMGIYPGKKILLFVLLLAGMMISCDSNRIFEENFEVENGVWKANRRLKFDVTISNIALRYNVYLNVRNSTIYPYSNLYLFLNTKYPDGKISRDTLELTLADYDGRWLGSGMGDIKFSRFLLQKGVQFRQKGKYGFELEQAMRVSELQGLRDIGLRIEKE
ncbi:MAG: gliding motility lipoprotein GldH [Bacteroidota bacterium]